MFKQYIYSKIGTCLLHFKSIIGVNSISATNIREMNTILQIRKWVYQQANNINTIVMSVQMELAFEIACVREFGRKIFFFLVFFLLYFVI